MSPASLDLSTWNVLGAQPSVDSSGAVTLPKGGELTQAFAGDGAAVRLVSRPYFGTKPPGLPGVEIGPATLTFTRGENGGALVLLGDEVLPLSFAIPLDVASRSQQSLDFTLSYHRSVGEATLAIRGQVFSFKVSPAAQSDRVTLMAGGDVEWRIDSIAITTAGEVGTNPAAGSVVGTGSGANKATAKDDVTRVPLNNETLKQIAALLAAGKSSDVLALLGRKSRRPADGALRHLELAHRCVQVAALFSAQADIDNTARMAALARQEAKLAADSSSNRTPSDTLADANEVAGFIDDRFLGDLEAAKTSYTATLRLDGERAGAIRALKQLAKSNITKS